ncbi:MAG: T9SS C-terminal target domain-containing protein [Candidatus Neomarinimicrobiota bacterium]|nr:MAG: T9SS C-terminal target domain-containing protein [Candidatus Neomarinimicrobiota bacterium]
MYIRMYFSGMEKVYTSHSRKRFIKIGLFLLTALVVIGPARSQSSSRALVLVIIDGARYSETFGDSLRSHIPRLDSIAQSGALATEFYNDSLTYTSRAIPALWCGSWTDVQDTVYQGGSTQYTKKPTIFEYFRKQTGADTSQCQYVLKYVPSLWLPSFRPDYGPAYWPRFVSQGSSDRMVLENALNVLEQDHPQLLLVYFADVDHAGHSGDWSAYLQAIETADSCVGALWSALQSDPFYANRTDLLVTNDHGRHDDQHGGFQGHGDGCDGCRHILFLAAGPDIQPGVYTAVYHRTPDFAVTACALLGLTPEYATGSVIDEIFLPTQSVTPASPLPTAVQLGPNFPNPFNRTTRIPFSLQRPAEVTVDILDCRGRFVFNLIQGPLPAGDHLISWSATDRHQQPVSGGIYIVRLRTEAASRYRKLVFLP